MVSQDLILKVLTKLKAGAGPSSLSKVLMPISI